VSDSLVLVLDAGGSSLRATLVDRQGLCVARAAVATPHIEDVPLIGRRWDPAVLWDAACRAVREVLPAAAGGAEDVSAVATTGQRLACAFLDAAGETLYVGPNVDARGVMNAWVVDEAAGAALYDRTGRGLALLFAPARLLWFRDEQPELFARVKAIVGLGDWLGQRLSGEAAVAVTSAVELLAHDVYQDRPLDEMWQRLGADPRLLPPVRPAGSVLGTVHVAAAASTGLRPGTPVAVTVPDSMAALLGSGAWRVGSTLILAGSTMPVLASADRPRADPTRRTWTGRHPIAGLGVNESNAGTTGFGWAWTVERLVGDAAGLCGDAAYARAEELAGRAPPGSRGVVSFAGGASVMHATQPSSFLPRVHAILWPSPVISSEVGAAEVLRSTLEAIAYSARVNLEQAEAARGGEPGPVVLTGGMARGALFRRILADVLGRELTVVTSDATAVGAAMCGAVAAGDHGSLEAAAGAMEAAGETLRPDATDAAAYAAGYHDWRMHYDKLHSL